MLAGESNKIAYQDLGRQVDLLHAINAAAATLQKSVNSEGDVFRVFSEQIANLGMRGGLSFLDEQRQMLTYYAIAQPGRKISELEELAGVKAEGYQIPVGKVDVYLQVIESGETIFVPESRTVMVQLLPKLAGRIADTVLKTLGSDPAIYAPLNKEGRVFGLMNIAGEGLTPDDVPALKAFANHVSVALENAQLFATLKQGKGRYRNLVDNLPIGVFRATPGPKGKILMANPAFLRMFGYASSTELDEIDLAEFYADKEEQKAFSDNLLAQGNNDNVEIQLKKKDGSLIWGSVTASVAWDPETGEAAYFDHFIEDITERLRVEEELFRQAEELATLHAISLDITAALALPTLLDTIVKHAARLLNARGGSLSLYDPEHREARVYAEYYPGLQDQTGRVFKYGEGAVGTVAKTARPLIIDDYRNWPQRATFHDLDLPYTAVLCVPLLWQGEVKGVLQVMDEVEVKRFKQSDMELLTLLANQAAIALFNARLFEAEHVAREQAETLGEVAQVVSGSLELNEVLRLILEQLKRVLVFNTSSVLIYQEPDGTALVASIGYEDAHLTSWKDSQLLLESPILKKMSQSLEPIMIPDVRQHPDWISASSAEQVRSFLAVPIISLGKMIGALMVYSELLDFYRQKDVQTAQSLAQHMAIAIQNARLFAAERASRERSDALREAARIVSASLSLEQVIDAVLEQLARVMEYDSGNVMLLRGDYLYLEAGRGYEAFIDPALLDEVVIDIRSHHSISLTLESGHPTMVADSRMDPDWQDTKISGHIRSWLGVPLRIRDKSIGLFNLDRITPGGFSAEEIALAQTFAVSTSAAIENARSFEAEGKRVVELEALHQASLSLTASLNLRAVLDAILKSTLQLLPGAQNAHIFLYHPDNGGQLTFGAVLWSDGFSDMPISEPRQNGLTYTVARSGEAILVSDMAEHPLFKDVPSDWKGSIIGLPLKIGDRVVGVMNISHTKAGAFSDDEMTVLRLLGDQAAIAIENAHLFEQAATERRHLSLLYDVGRGLAASLDSDEILNRATTLTCQALGGLLGEAFLYLPQEDMLSLWAVYGREGTELDSVREELQLNMGVGLVGWVAQNRQSVNVPEVTDDPRWLKVPGFDDRVHSALCAPILQGDHLFGVLAVLHHQPTAFSEDHLDLLQAICHQVGLALSNASRYQQVQDLVDLLEVEQQRLDDLVERLPVGVLLLDKNHRLLVANSLGSDILNLLGSGKIGEVFTKLGPYDLKDLISQHTDPLPVEFNLEKPAHRMFEAQVRPLGTEQSQWVITVREVTEEREVQARIQMQDRLATVGQLASGIAHDFNNIMAAIMVYTDLLQKDLMLFPTGSERLAIIQQQVQRATSLIRQILDFSRRSVMEQINLDLLPFIKELEKLLARVLPEIIRLELSYQSEEYWVNADPTRLQQVFMNLAVNARDAMPEGGTLFFNLDRLQIQPGERPPYPSMHSGEWIRIEVKDTGEGIPPEKLPHIFEPFFTTKPAGEGTGLGLAQAYGIVKQHDGFIDVRSQVGVGTIFTVYLPALSMTEQETMPREDIAEIEGEGETILVVEDDWVTLAALRDLLETQNYHVLIAQNGIEALEIIEESSDSINLIVCDVVMPEMGGLALYNSLHERYPQIKMLFITGHPLQKENQALLEKGGVNWLQKPFSVPDFSRVVQELLEEN